MKARYRRRRMAMHVPRSDELAFLMNAADPETRLWIEVAVVSGVTATEQSWLSWADVDLVRGVVVVRPPAHGADRLVPIPKETARRLRVWRQQARFSGDEDFVFANARGGPQAPRTIRAKFRRLWANIEQSSPGREIRRFDRNSLRIIAIHRWIASGHSDQAIAHYLGCSQTTIRKHRPHWVGDYMEVR